MGKNAPLPPQKNAPWVFTCTESNILGPTPKFKIRPPIFSSPRPDVSKKVCHIPVGHKPREEIDFIETGCFWTRALPGRPADLRLPPKNCLCRVELVLIISLFVFHSIKSYSFFQSGKTDTETDR